MYSFKAATTLSSELQLYMHCRNVSRLARKLPRCNLTRPSFQHTTQQRHYPSGPGSPSVTKGAVTNSFRAAKYAGLSLVGTGIIVAGGLVAYAKSDPELRDWLTLDKVLEAAHQEGMTFGESFIANANEYFGFTNLEDSAIDLCELDV